MKQACVESVPLRCAYLVSLELTVGALGVLAAGGCYVALHPDYPDDGLRFVLAASGAQIVVAKPGVATRFDTPRATEPIQSAERITTTFVPAPLCEPVLASVARDEDDDSGLAPRRRWGRFANRSTWTSMLCSAQEPTEVACTGRVR